MPPVGSAPGDRLALVVANSRYTDPTLAQLRAPAQDAAAMASVLADPAVGGFTVTRVMDRPAHEIKEEINEFLAERTTRNVVVVYLSCHGVLDARGRLYFATGNTIKNRLAATAVESAWLLDQLEECSARQQVVILDCCFSGAFEHAKGVADVDLERRLYGAARGRVVLTASRAAEYSYEGQAITGAVGGGSVFTTALVEGLRGGAADLDRKGHVTVEDAYVFAADWIKSQGGNQNPQRWLYGSEGDIVLAQTPRAARPSHARDEPVREPPSLPAGQDDILHLTPGQIIGRIGDLRNSGRDAVAGQVLAAIGELRSGQETVAIIGLLERSNRAEDIDAVIAASARRDPYGVLAVLRALHATGRDANAACLLQTVAQAPPLRVAAVAGALAGDDESPGTADLERLLDAAIANTATPDAINELVGALSACGLGAHGDRLLERASEGVQAERALGMADALRAGGNENAAFRFYVKAVDLLVRRPPDEIAVLVEAVRRNGRPEQADGIVHAAIEHAGTPDAMAALLGAFSDAQLHDDVDQAYDSVAFRFDDDAILELAGLLRGGRRADEALQIYLQAAAGRSADTTLRFVRDLQNAGRPVDAHRLLSNAGQLLPLVETVRVVAGLVEADRCGDSQRVVDAASTRSRVMADEFYDAFCGDISDEVPEWIGRLLACQGPQAVLELTGMLRESGRRDRTALVLDSIAQYCDVPEATSVFRLLSVPDAIQLIVSLALRNSGNLSEIITELIGAGGREPASAGRELLAPVDITNVATLLAGLRQAAQDGYADALIRGCVSLEPYSIAVVVHELRGLRRTRDAERILEAVGKKAASSMTEIIVAFFERRQSADIDYLVDIVATRSREYVTDVAQDLYGARMTRIARDLTSKSRSHQKGGRKRRLWDW